MHGFRISVRFAPANISYFGWLLRRNCSVGETAFLPSAFGVATRARTATPINFGPQPGKKAQRDVDITCSGTIECDTSSIEPSAFLCKFGNLGDATGVNCSLFIVYRRVGSAGVRKNAEELCGVHGSVTDGLDMLHKIKF